MSDNVNELKRMILDQQYKLDRLEKQVRAAETQAEAAEQYSRQDCLILRGKLAIRTNCSLRDEVMRIIEFHTGVRFPSWCLNTVHWLGGGTSLIVRFNNKAVRDEIYRNRVPRHVDKRGLFIHESLTPSKMSLVTRCAGLRKQEKVCTYYTQGGHVMVKRTKDAPSVLVTPDMSNEDIMAKLEKQPRSYREAVAQQQSQKLIKEQGEQQGGTQSDRSGNPNVTPVVLREETVPKQRHQEASQKERHSTDTNTDGSKQSNCAAEKAPDTHTKNGDDGEEQTHGQTGSKQKPKKAEDKPETEKTDENRQKHKQSKAENRGGGTSVSGSSQDSDTSHPGPQENKELKDKEGLSKPEGSRSPSHSPSKRMSKRRRDKRGN